MASFLQNEQDDNQCFSLISIEILTSLRPRDFLHLSSYPSPLFGGRLHGFVRSGERKTRGGRGKGGGGGGLRCLKVCIREYRAICPVR